MAGTVANDFADGSGHVKLANGETWTARLSPAAEGVVVEAGHRVTVVSIQGATAVVAPIERIAL